LPVPIGDKMKRHRHIKTGFLLIASILASIHFAEAQQPMRVARIGWLTAAPHSAMAPRTEAFRRGLRELGYVEGKNNATFG
jgi:putative tryptophan/tyrosine transport system substrate-binding protein